MQIVSAVNSRLSYCDFSHTIIGGNFQHSDIWHCGFSQSEKGEWDFTGSRLIGVDFSKSFMPSCKMRFVDGSHLDFTNTELGGADLSFSNLPDCNFENASVHDCLAISSNFEGSKFSVASISESDFRLSDLYRCLFQNVTLDRMTKFGRHYEESDRPVINVDKFLDINSMWENKVLNWGGEEANRLAEKKVWTLQALQDVAQANSLIAQAREFYFQRKETQRRLEASSGRYTNPSWIVSTVNKYLMGYGERPINVVIWSIFVIFFFSVLYEASGGVTGTKIDSGNVRLVIPIMRYHVRIGIDFLTNLYFSSLTFTTLGYGDLQPSTWSVRLLATIESFIGALLMALFVFVLGKRTSW